MSRSKQLGISQATLWEHTGAETRDLTPRERTASGHLLPHPGWGPRPCRVGSDIHVMLALCCRSRQVVMANEERNGTDMVGELLGKRQRRAYQTRNSLSQRVVEPFEVIGFAR